MKYEFNDKINLPKSVLERKDREEAMATLQKGVSDAVAEIEKPITKILGNLAKDSLEKRQFESLVAKTVQDLRDEIDRSNEYISKAILEQKSVFTGLKDIIQAQHEEIKEQNNKKKTVKVDNLGDIILPEVPKEFKVEFKDKQEVYGKVDTGLKFPDVQVIKFAKEPEPPVVNVTEKIIKFPEIQIVKLKDKIPAPIVKVEQKNVKFPAVQKVKFENIPTVKIHNPQSEVKIKNLKDLKLEVPDKFSIDNLPVAKGKKPSVKHADPEFYIPVRITTGEEFNDNIGGGGSVMGGGASSLAQAWITTSGAVTDSSDVLLETNTMRQMAILTNDSESVIYLSFGEHAKLGAGIRLNPEGGAYEIDRSNLFKGNIFAICNDTIANLCITEVSGKVY